MDDSGQHYLARLHRALPPASSAVSYAVAAVVIVICAVLKVILDQTVGGLVPPFVTSYPAVVIAAVLGGPAVGMAAAVTTLFVAWYFWLEPTFSFAIPELLTGTTLAIYIFTAPFIALVVGVARLSWDRAAASESERAAAARESVHRTKNLIAVVQALTYKVAREVTTAAEFRDVLTKRLQALAIAQNVLIRREWQDADLEELLQSALAPFLPNPGLTVRKGEHVGVPARHVRGLCMALYELCTNAMKYGALAYGRGPATLSWHLEGNDCVLEWREEVGTDHAKREENSGFGTTLIRLALSNDAGTIVQYEVTPTLVLATFRWPDARTERTQPIRDERSQVPGMPGLGTPANQDSAV